MNLVLTINEYTKYQYNSKHVALAIYGKEDMRLIMEQVNECVLCSRAIRENICDWKGKMEGNDYLQADVLMWGSDVVNMMI